MSETGRLLRAEKTVAGEGDFVWPIETGDALETYNLRLMLLEHRPLPDLLHTRKARGRPTNLVDYLGSGAFARETGNIDSMTGVRLEDVPLGSANAQEENPITIVPGNIYSSSLWHNLRAHMREHNIPAFDIATCFAGEKFKHLTKSAMGYEHESATAGTKDYLALYYPLLARAYALLNTDGALYTDIPDIGLTGEVLEAWQIAMARHNIDVQYYKTTMMSLKRNLRSPSKLPIFDIREILDTAMKGIEPNEQILEELEQIIGRLSRGITVEEVMTLLTQAKEHNPRVECRDTFMLRQLIYSGLRAL